MSSDDDFLTDMGEAMKAVAELHKRAKTRATKDLNMVVVDCLIVIERYTMHKVGIQGTDNYLFRRKMKECVMTGRACIRLVSRAIELFMMAAFVA